MKSVGKKICPAGFSTLAIMDAEAHARNRKLSIFLQKAGSNDFQAGIAASVGVVAAIGMAEGFLISKKGMSGRDKVGTRANLQLRTFVRGVSQFAYMYIVNDKMTFECACHIMDRIV